MKALIGLQPCEGVVQAAESGWTRGDGGDVWQSYKDRGAVNKAACVIYGVKLKHKNPMRGCTHLQKHSQEVCLSLRSLRFMWRPDVCPPFWKHTEWGDLLSFPAKKLNIAYSTFYFRIFDSVISLTLVMLSIQCV